MPKRKTKGVVKKLEKKVNKLIKAEKGELHWRNSGSPPFNVQTIFGQPYNDPISLFQMSVPTSMSIGSGNGSRIGNMITKKSYNCHYQLFLDQVTTGNYPVIVRIMLLEFKKLVGIPTIDQVLELGNVSSSQTEEAVLAQYNIANRRNFKVLYDKYHSMRSNISNYNATGAGVDVYPQMNVGNISVSLKDRVATYNGASGGSVDLAEGQLYLLAISNANGGQQVKCLFKEALKYEP